jgi:hypothetical protein
MGLINPVGRIDTSCISGTMYKYSEYMNMENRIARDDFDSYCIVHYTDTVLREDEVLLYMLREDNVITAELDVRIDRLSCRPSMPRRPHTHMR